MSTIEMDLRRKIVQLEQENAILKQDTAEANKRAAEIYGEYQILQYVIGNSPTEHDLLFLKGRVKLLEDFLDKELHGWRFKLGKDHQEGPESAACLQSNG